MRVHNCAALASPSAENAREEKCRAIRQRGVLAAHGKLAHREPAGHKLVRYMMPNGAMVRLPVFLLCVETSNATALYFVST